ITGNNIVDVTGYPHTVVATGSVLFHEAGPLADGNFAMKFTGGTAASVATLAATLDSAEAITCEAWIKVPVANHYGGIVTKSITSGAGYAFLLFVWNGSVFWRVYRDGATLAQTNSAAINLNQWYHVVGTYDGVWIRLYLNGTLVGLTLFQGPLNKGAGALW